MKKTIAMILATLMLLAMLAGCKKPSQNTGNSNPQPANNETPGTTQPVTQPQTQSQAAIGAILDAPEVKFDTSIEDLYIHFSYPGEEENEVLSMEIAVDQLTEDSYVLYVTDGLLKLNETIYEVTDTGITKYNRDVLTENFEQDTSLTQEQLKEEENSILDLLSMFMVVHTDWQGMQYQKTGENAFAITGEVYTYDVINSGEVYGKISIDKATGLMVSLKDANGTTLYSVQDIQTANLEIPKYK